MYLSFDESTKKRIEKILNADANRKLLMAYQDGVSPYVGAETAMMVNFVFAIVGPNQPIQWFDETIDSDLGPVLIKGYSKQYMENNMVLKSTAFGSMELLGDGGVIDDSPKILDATDDNEFPSEAV